MLNVALCSMFHTARLNRERLAWAGSHYATTGRVLRHALGFGVHSSDPVHCSRPWAFGYDFAAGDFRSKGTEVNPRWSFLATVCQAYNGQKCVAPRSLHRPAPL